MRNPVLPLGVMLCATLALFAGAQMGAASAVNLAVAPTHTLQTAEARACTQSAINVSISLRNVLSLTNIPEICFNKPILIHTMVKLGNAVDISVTASGSSVDVPLTSGLLANNLLGVQIVIDGWAVPSKWLGLL